MPNMLARVSHAAFRRPIRPAPRPPFPGPNRTMTLTRRSDRPLRRSVAALDRRGESLDRG